MDRAPRRIADYDMVMDPIRTARHAKSGNQPGDPVKAARALLALVQSPNPPARLFLGDDALMLVDEKLTAMRAEDVHPKTQRAQREEPQRPTGTGAEIHP